MTRKGDFATRAVFAAIAVDVLLVALHHGRELEGLVDLFPAVAAAAASAACGFAAVRRTDRIARRGWALLAIAAAGWTTNAAALGTTELVRLLSGVVATVAVLHLLGGTVAAATKVRVLVDGLVASTSLILLAWGPGLGLRLAAGEGASRFLLLSAPVTDIVVLAVLLAVGVRLATWSRRSWTLLVLAFGLLGAGDGVLAWVKLGGLLETAAANHVCWTAGALLILLAARNPIGKVPALAQEASPTRPFAVLLPYAPLLLAGAVTASEWVLGTLDSALVGIGGALVALLVVRQLLAQFEAMAATRALDALLGTRTEELQRQEHQMRSLVQHASDLLTIVGASDLIRYQSGATEPMLGVAPTTYVGRSIRDIVHPDDVALFDAALLSAQPPPHAPSRIDVRLLHADERWIHTETTIADLRSDVGIQGRLLTIRDVTDRRMLEAQLRHEALHDPLTGLGNRLLFHDRLSHAAQQAARNPQTMAVLVLDLDGFKDVNDTLGHAAGDQLLCEVADRLRRTLRPGDTIARMGGDEFAVLLERAEPGVAETVSSRILAGLRAPVDIDGRAIVPRGSMGIAAGTTDRTTADTLLRGADLALYQAKLRGKGGYAVFQEGMQQAATLRVELENDLRRAVRQGELLLQYQPIVEVPSGRVSGVEALVRWQHPTRGLVPPNEFIPVAEASDLVLDVGRWVLWEAARQLRTWQDRFPPPFAFTMSVNVATRQLLSPWFVPEVRRVLDETNVDPSSLILEITEGALMSDGGQIEETMSELRALGVRLAIDDFGTGWSSLSRLRAFPVDKLKIDRSFVREIATGDDRAPLIAAIVAMAHGLGLTLVAEGVETLEQLACLHGLGCEEVQGFLLSRPIGADELGQLVAAPGGLLLGTDAPRDATGAVAPSQSDDRAELMAVVASAAGGTEGTQQLSAILDALQRESGLDAVYLTEIAEEARQQTVTAVSSDVPAPFEPGCRIPWDTSPCVRMLRNGPRTANLAAELPKHPLVGLGAVTHLSVPVRDPDGVVRGSLCGASHSARSVQPGLVVLFELFAALIVQHLIDRADADLIPPAPTPPLRLPLPLPRPRRDAEWASSSPVAVGHSL
jgi:diguanylate cyclase (GGDEF)-like protein/PAS domain S-box-containing protein